MFLLINYIDTYDYHTMNHTLSDYFDQFLQYKQPVLQVYNFYLVKFCFQNSPLYLVITQVQRIYLIRNLVFIFRVSGNGLLFFQNLPINAPFPVNQVDQNLQIQMHLILLALTVFVVLQACIFDFIYQFYFGQIIFQFAQPLVIHLQFRTCI